MVSMHEFEIRYDEYIRYIFSYIKDSFVCTSHLVMYRHGVVGSSEICLVVYRHLSNCSLYYKHENVKAPHCAFMNSIEICNIWLMAS